MRGTADILIISAEYGLIRSDELIEDYDRRMDVSRARELNDSVIRKLKQALENAEYENLLINLGKDYMEVIRGFERILPSSTKVIILSGIIGERKRELRTGYQKMARYKISCQKAAQPLFPLQSQ